MPAQTEASESVLNYGDHLSALVLGTLVVCIVKILYRFNVAYSEKGTIEAGPITVCHERFWVIPVGATVLHALLAYYFVDACRAIDGNAIRAATATALADGEPLLFGGLGPMKKWITLPLLGDFYLISSMLTRVLFYSWVAILFVSLYRPKEGLSWRAFAIRNCPVLLLCAVNWLIGGQWAIAASALFAKPT